MMLLIFILLQSEGDFHPDIFPTHPVIYDTDLNFSMPRDFFLEAGSTSLILGLKMLRQGQSIGYVTTPHVRSW